MASNTTKLKLLIQEQEEYYNIDKFNENFEKIDRHATELEFAMQNMDIDGGRFEDVNAVIVFDGGTF